MHTSQHSTAHTRFGQHAPPTPTPTRAHTQHHTPSSHDHHTRNSHDLTSTSTKPEKLSLTLRQAWSAMGPTWALSSSACSTASLVRRSTSLIKKHDHAWTHMARTGVCVEGDDRGCATILTGVCACVVVFTSARLLVGKRSLGVCVCVQAFAPAVLREDHLALEHRVRLHNQQTHHTAHARSATAAASKPSSLQPPTPHPPLHPP
jgi:hypothetical protein